jgi:rhamnosyl/mannosyltransferase
MPNPSAFWALALGRAKNIPWVIHWHADVVTSSMMIRLLYRLYRPFEQRMLKRSSAIVATSEAYRSSSESLQKYPEKCRVIPLGIDPRPYASGAVDEQATGDRKDSQELQLLAIGRLTYYKGFDYLLKAMAQVENARLTVVGSGAEEKKLKALAGQLEIEDKVLFHGALPDDELIRQIVLSDCLCLPSIERTEAFGIVLLEAMCLGKATLVSDVPGSGMGWVVDDGVTGIKVPPADPESLAGAINRLSEDREALAVMGRRGQQKFNRDFDIRQSILPLIGLYRDLAGPEVK